MRIRACNHEGQRIRQRPLDGAREVAEHMLQKQVHDAGGMISSAQVPCDGEHHPADSEESYPTPGRTSKASAPGYPP